MQDFQTRLIYVWLCNYNHSIPTGGPQEGPGFDEGAMPVAPEEVKKRGVDHPVTASGVS